MHKRSWVVCLVAGVSLFSSDRLLQLHADAQKQKHLSRNELRRQIRDAHTPEQYHALAEYFRAEEIRFRSKAQMEEKELIRLREKTVVLPSKYPTPIDSARQLYQYYALQADEMGHRASEFEERVASRNGTAVTADRK
jgi:hypothetical protein